MEQWRGVMNWPTKPGWACEICGASANALIWGLAHATCRCGCCHTQYRMRNSKDEIVDIPICQLKNEYRKPVKLGWEKFHEPFTYWSDELWDELFQEASKEQTIEK